MVEKHLVVQPRRSTIRRSTSFNVEQLGYIYSLVQNPCLSKKTYNSLLPTLQFQLLPRPFLPRWFSAFCSAITVLFMIWNKVVLAKFTFTSDTFFDLNDVYYFRGSFTRYTIFVGRIFRCIVLTCLKANRTALGVAWKDGIWTCYIVYSFTSF